MKITAVLMSVLLSSASYATTWIRCDSCDSNSAQTYSVASGYRGAVVVYNLPAGNAFRFFNEMQGMSPDCNPNAIDPGTKSENRTSQGCQMTLVGTPEALLASDLPLKNALVDFFNATDGTLQAKATFNAEAVFAGAGPITEQIGGSAYDFQHNAIYRGQLTNASRVLSNSLQTIASWSNLKDIVSTAVGTQLLGMDDSELKVTIAYADGSKTIIKFDIDMDVVSTRSETAEGRDIVTLSTINEFTDLEMRFNNDQSLQNFFNTLAFMNVPVTSTYYQMPLTGSCRAITNGVSCTRPK